MGHESIALMGWATHYIERLRAGEAVSFRPRGASMKGRIESGHLCTVVPVDCSNLSVGDILLCKVHGAEYGRSLRPSYARRASGATVQDESAGPQLIGTRPSMSAFTSPTLRKRLPESVIVFDDGNPVGSSGQGVRDLELPVAFRIDIEDRQMRDRSISVDDGNIFVRRGDVCRIAVQRCGNSGVLSGGPDCPSRELTSASWATRA
jgi:hypothetical protein